MTIEIIAPDKEIFKGDASQIQLPGVDGLFAILNLHAPLIALLKQGKIKITGENEQITQIDIMGGVVEVKNNKVLVLADM
ncbi:MAG TPA: ATP synthase F1 subunit epsilon [Bacteroidales bacterium]|jgi:F-type H+-transporting ATPase subunit epsilon|nr:ATP synthase F1 subunit epsilon [Bacteroidales bacterium]HQA86100.1 ATP synthase F1 subunit epsilon [Bacteroidales bacterium]